MIKLTRLIAGCLVLLLLGCSAPPDVPPAQTPAPASAPAAPAAMQDTTVQEKADSAKQSESKRNVPAEGAAPKKSNGDDMERLD